MATFQIKKGLSSSLNNETVQEGKVLFTTDSNKLYIDVSNESGGRRIVNAEKADRLNINSAGGPKVPIYFNEGLPQKCDNLLDVNISGNANSATYDIQNNSITNTYVRKINYIGAETDFNTVTESGFYRFEVPYANGPSMSYGQLIVCHGGGDTVGQIAMEYSTNKVQVRAGNPPDVGGNGRWCNWDTLLTTNTYNETLDNAYVRKSGDQMTGPLSVHSNLTVNSDSYFNGTIHCTANTPGYAEGMRFEVPDGAWATIAMGCIGPNGTHENCWSIHRKCDNNFAISRNSSDGLNGLVMTSTGMGLGTAYPSARLHVVGTTYISGHLMAWHTDQSPGANGGSIEIREYNTMGVGTDEQHIMLNSPRLGFHWGNRYWGQICLYKNMFHFMDGHNNLTAYYPIKASQVWGAVWNDYAEYRICEDDFKPGQVVCENNDDTLSISTYRLQPGASIVSDTFGFAIGETEEATCPIAVSGRVLAYCEGNREDYCAGDAVCAGPNGTVSRMTREEIKEYPERIIGTVSAVPNYEIWGSGKVEINGRIWIKVK